MKRNYLVGYDIADPKRLRKVAKVMSAFGARIQYSFFHCYISNAQKKRLKERIKRIVDEDEDQVIILPVTEKQIQEMECIGFRIHLSADGIIII